MKPVLCIRNDRYDTLGIAPSTLAEHGIPTYVLDAFAEASADPGRVGQLPSVAEISGLIVFGGAMNVDEIERFPYLKDQRKLMLQAVESGVPVLGICLGAQMLARALGAAVYRAPKRELGFVPLTLTDAGRRDVLLSAFQSGDRVFEWHQDTFDLPEGTDLLATGEAVPAQAFRAGLRAWGIQFHFEINTEGVQAWIDAVGPGFERTWARSPDSVREELRTHLPGQQRRSRRLLKAFGRQVMARA